MSTETQTAELVKTPPATTPSRVPVPIGHKGIEITEMEGLWRFATAVSKSGLAPKGIETPEAIFVAIQMGLEVGLTPMAALQNIAVINGRPSIWGDAMLGIVRSTGRLVEFTEWFESGGQKLPRNPVNYADDTTAICRIRREGFEPVEVGFSVADAKRAGLWGKSGPWTQYPFRMLKYRARAFNLPDQFGDALRGMLSAEEAGDIPPMKPAEATLVDAGVTFGKRMRELPTGTGEPTGTQVQTISHPATAPAVTMPSDAKTTTDAKPQDGSPSGLFAPAEKIEAPTAKAKLAKIITDAGFTWDQFREWAGSQFSKTDCDGFETMAESDAAIFVTGSKLMLKELAKAKGAK